MKKDIVKLAASHAASCSRYATHTEELFDNGECDVDQVVYAQGKVDGADELCAELASFLIKNKTTEELVSDWAEARNLIKGSTPKDQCLKLVQEVGELSDSLCKGKNPIDDIGDCLVVLTILARQLNLTLEECMKHAYEEIKDRKGVMREGVFIKEADL